MTKNQQFTRVATDSEPNFTSQPAIPLQAITSPAAASNSNTSPVTPDANPHVVHFSPISPTRRSSIPIEEEWPLAPLLDIPQELRAVDDTNAANNTEANSMRTDWKRNLFLLLEDPSSSNAAFTVNVLVSFSITLSAVLTTIETIPSLRSDTMSSVW
jgi:hypothetical protein